MSGRPAQATPGSGANIAQVLSSAASRRPAGQFDGSVKSSATLAAGRALGGGRWVDAGTLRKRLDLERLFRAHPIEKRLPQLLRFALDNLLPS
jgi:hypothetical protein